MLVKEKKCIIFKKLNLAMELIVTCWEDSLKPGDQLGEEGPFRGQVEEAEGLHHGAHSSGGQRRR